MPGIIPPGHPMALPQGQTIPNWLLRRIGTVATLGLYNFNQPAKDNAEYWGEIAHELDPRTPQGLVALGATVFGPRLDDPAVTAIKGSNGELVPLPRVNVKQRVTSNPVRNLKHDFAHPVVARAIRARETEPVSKHIESVAKRAGLASQPENVHDLLENNDMTRGAPFRLPRIVAPGLASALRPAQTALLKKLLANRL